MISKRRLILVYSFFLIFFVLILIRLFYWQVLQSESLVSIGDSQRTSELIIPSSRGKILASDLTHLVLNKKAFGIYIEPKKIKNREEVINRLSLELDIPSSSISARLQDTSLVWIPIKHKVDGVKIENIRKYELSGITFLDEEKRFYPESSMAAQLLGFVGSNAKGEDQGYFGIEGFYDEQLRGRNGFVNFEKDASGLPILSGEREEILPENGRDFVLHLDRTIQYIIETKLKEALQKYGAKGGNIVILDPFTGGILGMASFPSYFQGEYAKYPAVLYKNPVISSFYEPGSTFKTLVMGIALNEGKITLETKFDETGPIEIGGYSIKTWNQKYHGSISIGEILQYSSNVGMVFIERQLDKEVFLRYLRDLGFGNLTNVDLQEEAVISLRPSNKWYEIDYATASFGQGIAVTPLQMVIAVAAIANGGNLLEPHVVKSIRLQSGEEIDIKPKIKRQIFSKKTTNLIKEMMVQAIENGETKYLKIPGIRIAGKTGTAQISIAGHYDTEKTIASFVGFAPVEQPRFVMLVTLQEPSSSPWGSETAAPLFFSIAKELFNYLKISS